jgi:uridine kinase
MEKPYIVGITGGSASGKTLFLRSLQDAFKSDDICLLSQDNYYQPLHLQPLDENGRVNYDTPQSINIEEYEKDLLALKEGREVKRLEYIFNNPDKKPREITLKPSPIIVVEGIFVLYFPHLSEMIDLKLFIDAKEHVKLKRRIDRDKVERAMPLEDVLYQYQYHVAPTYEKYIKPFKYDADLVIPNNNNFNTALQVLIAFLRTKIEKK